MTDEALRELAWCAVVTPSLDAPEAFQVLADALIERGDVRELDEAEATVDLGPFFGTTRRPATVAEQAWQWAQEATLLPLLERLRLASQELHIVTTPWGRSDFFDSVRESLRHGAICLPPDVRVEFAASEDIPRDTIVAFTEDFASVRAARRNG